METTQFEERAGQNTDLRTKISNILMHPDKSEANKVTDTLWQMEGLGKQLCLDLISSLVEEFAERGIHTGKSVKELNEQSFEELIAASRARKVAEAVRKKLKKSRGETFTNQTSLPQTDLGKTYFRLVPCLLVGLIPLGLFYLFITLAVESFNQVTTWEPATAMKTATETTRRRVRKDGRDQWETTYWHTIEFEANGELVETRVSDKSNHWNPNILYNPDNPTEVVTNGFTHFWGPPFVALIFAVFTAGLALIYGRYEYQKIPRGREQSLKYAPLWKGAMQGEEIFSSRVRRILIGGGVLIALLWWLILKYPNCGYNDSMTYMESDAKAHNADMKDADPDDSAW